MSRDTRFKRIYQLLDTHHGPQNWWPADTPFEVMVGAVLVQNTAWKNASSAIARLKEADLLSPKAILQMPVEKLALCIRSSGHFNVKAKRLQALCLWLDQQGGVDRIIRQSSADLREDLLAVYGIGPETADDILLYALGEPVFIIDAYTRRLFSRLGLLQSDEPYEVLRKKFESALQMDAGIFNQYHALIVVHAKNTCKKQPVCSECCLAGVCDGVWKSIL